MSQKELVMSKVGEYLKRFGNMRGDSLEGEITYGCNEHGWDLYSLIDIIYVLYMAGLLKTMVSESTRRKWIRNIVECQNEYGYFALKNTTSHTKEHATAYAISALLLLSNNNSPSIFEMIRPIPDLKNLILEKDELKRWLMRMGFAFPIKDFRFGLKYGLKKCAKHLGWHHIWPGSHIGGGIAAAIAIAGPHLTGCTNDQIGDFFDTYFEILNGWVDKKYGLWKRGVLDAIRRNVSISDIGGAVHFLWIYDFAKERYPYPARLLESCLKFQRDTGLVKDKPFCIDFDFTYTIARSFLQLEGRQKELYQKKTNRYLRNNYRGIIEYISKDDWLISYKNTHGFPGALASLSEVQSFYKSYNIKFENFLHHPFEKVCWL